MTTKNGEDKISNDDTGKDDTGEDGTSEDDIGENEGDDGFAVAAGHSRRSHTAFRNAKLLCSGPNLSWLLIG